MFTVRKATTADVEWIISLLRNANINDRGVDKHLHRFLVVEDPAQSNSRVGTVGLEVYGEQGLLRSFVMESESWNATAGLQLIGVVLAYTGRLGLRNIYLLTGMAQTIFEHFGFREVDWEKVPADIRRSDHAFRAKREGGVAMVYRRSS